MRQLEEYKCDMCLSIIEAHRTVSVEERHGRIVVESYCECLPEIRRSVFDPHDPEVARLTGGADLPYRNPRPVVPQWLVDREVERYKAVLLAA